MSKTSWSTRWERLRTVPGLGRDVSALLVLIVMGVTSAAIIQAQLGFGLFADHVRVRAEFAQVPGVNPESSNIVTIAGVKVGRVADWEATSRGTAILTLDLDKRHEVYANARAVVRPKNPLNETSVEINPGGPPAARLADNGLIPLAQTRRPVQADEVLSHLDQRSQLAITDLLVESDIALTRSADHLPGGLAATTETADTLKPVVESLQARREKIARLVTALSQIASSVGENDDRIARLASATEDTLGVLAGNDAAVRQTLEQLPGLGDQLRGALSSTQALTKQLDPTLTNLDKASGSLPAALERFESTVDGLGKTVDAAAPVVAKARPVVADLRPMAVDLDRSLIALRPVTSALDRDTRTVMSYLTDIRAFVYNTSSVFGAGDAEGGIVRGHLVVPLPGGGVLPNENVQTSGGDR
jgi:phospholipid/cholesterol/gamma-HCH transport system substrate-binding protein